MKILNLREFHSFAEGPINSTAGILTPWIDYQGFALSSCNTGFLIENAVWQLTDV